MNPSVISEAVSALGVEGGSAVTFVSWVAYQVYAWKFLGRNTVVGQMIKESQGDVSEKLDEIDERVKEVDEKQTAHIQVTRALASKEAEIDDETVDDYLVSNGINKQDFFKDTGDGGEQPSDD